MNVRSCLLIALFALVPQVASAGELFPRVLVTVEPLKPYVNEILSGIGSAQLVTRPGQDPHTMGLSPSQARALDSAEIIIVPDRALNIVLGRQLAEKERRGALVIALTELKGAKPLRYTKGNAWIGAEEKEVEDEAYDPHLWLDPLRMANIAAPLAEAIAQKAPSHKAEMLHNAKRLAAHLQQEVHPQLKAMLKPAAFAKPAYQSKPIIPFVTYHDAYRYFFARYGIAPPGEILKRPEEYLGARSMKAVLEAAEKNSIRCVVSEAETSLVKRIAALSGARIAHLNPERAYGREEAPSLNWIKNDYDRLLYRAADTFAGCS